MTTDVPVKLHNEISKFKLLRREETLALFSHMGHILCPQHTLTFRPPLTRKPVYLSNTRPHLGYLELFGVRNRDCERSELLDYMRGEELDWGGSGEPLLHDCASILTWCSWQYYIQ